MTTGEIAGEMTKAPALFLRNATGLVKGWSGFDAFAYSFMSVNLVTLGMFYSLALWAPIYGFILKIEVVQPLVALIGWTDGSTFFATNDGTFAVSLFTILIASGAVALGMAGYARIQRWCLWIGVGALVVIFG